ncbi:bifunctional proline dehydrogenase/L-glutamate gamma-semialdehyde dehydrogenase PutA [Bradyrhizobium sp. STM 3562]|uniref:bifunctional proline dehydrogenase/L-glutamate gamma-semialdehyde dehydrogenase PutA n=1 Tax=Bradyrhizobium sp. STM 3562 TaxID=578924 RepID=UPI0038906E03
MSIISSVVGSYSQDDADLARSLLEGPELTPEQERNIDQEALLLIAAIRGSQRGIGGLEDVLREYSLSTKEGLALMTLAEALLRVPDAETADRFIEDRLGHGNFALHELRSDTPFVNASSWALGMAARIVRPDETIDGTLARITKQLGLPTIRVVARQAMRIMGNHFVMGQTIEAALDRAMADTNVSRRYSFDMLGEGARTRADAERYFQSYHSAIEAIGRRAGAQPLPDRPGLSVKLSALHPRFEAISRSRLIDELVPLVLQLARRAKAYDLNFTLDAEEADRLELSLDIVDAVLEDGSLAGWKGFGLAIQAYQKRALAVIDHIAALASKLDRPMMVRLVKGAYWDTELKRAQERGLDGYPVFTRKAMTDLNYIACARKLLSLRPLIYPQFATHNALTVATILELTKGSSGFELQRLHGMGDALYADIERRHPGIAYRTYAPVGGHRDLLAYLVRRLLENGANSSFVAQVGDKAIPAEKLLTRPASIISRPEQAANSGIPLPRHLFADRLNSAGVEMGDRTALENLVRRVAAAAMPAEVAPIVDGNVVTGALRSVRNPATGEQVGQVSEADLETVDAAVEAAARGFVRWQATDVGARAATIERAADMLEAQTPEFIALLQREAGKTLDDAIAEVREAVDFCRYYAGQARSLFGRDNVLPGPTGESNVLRLRPRGAFVAISPWNFPLAIFMGQVVAALVAGNTVVAKPAEQTPLIAAQAVRLLLAAGIPAHALHLVIGDGSVGARIVQHRSVSGVVFTGSTAVARSINRQLAAKEGPILPLIAETGGINAMIVDATSLAEQVTDDVVTSAFRSAGQRCSALRIMYVQSDVADQIIDMIAGAASELKVGDPSEISTHIGPVIDAEAKARLDAYIAGARSTMKLHYAGTAPAAGTFVAPHVLELDRLDGLREEVFGPVLHVVRYRAEQLDDVIAAIESSGFGLTLGIHSRIDDVVQRIASRLATGNVYVNRNMIGAVVGVQPFGGCGLSGTGPKAGGPHYLLRFATEQTVTINTAAAGGNATLMAQA